MRIAPNKQTVVAAFVSTLLAGSVALGSITLAGCSSSDDRQAKYLERAQAALDKGDFDKARVDLKNVLQINTSNARARLLFAQLEERQQNWPQMYANLNAAVEADPKLIEARVKLAELLVAANQQEQATQQIDKILAQDPNNTEGLAARAGLLYREKKIDEAEAVCKRILELKPGHPTASGLLAAIYGANDPANAQAVVESALKQNPDNTTLQLVRIQLLTRQQKQDDVIAAYAALIKQKPAAVLYVTQLANYYISLDRIDDAEKTLRDAVARVPDSNEAKLVLVELLAKHRKPEDARSTLEQFSAAAPDNYRLRTALARLYIALRDIDKATATFQYAIDKDPKSADAIDARNRLAELAVATGKKDRADSLIADVLKIEPENGDALLLRARFALAANQPEAAIADLRTVTKNAPDSAPALELLATAQERSGSTNLALDTYQKLLQVNPDHIGALIGSGRLLLAQNKFDEAQKPLEHARKLMPTNLEATRQLVDLYSRRGNFDQAMPLCDELLLNQKTQGIGFYLQGQVLTRKKDFPAAIAAMRKALEKEPRALEPLQMLVGLYQQQKQLPEAIAYLEQYVKANPDMVHGREYLAALYRVTGKSEQAEQLLMAIIEKDSKRISAYRELAAVYAQKNQREKIESLLMKGLEKNPDDVGLSLLLAESYQFGGKHDLALAQYNKLEKLQPQAPGIKNNLAALLIDKFPSEENLRRAQTLTESFARSDNPLYIDTVGWLHYKLKNYPQSISLLESAVRKAPLPELQYHLGMAYLANNMPAQAKELLGKATASAALFPGRDVAEEALRKL